MLININVLIYLQLCFTAVFFISLFVLFFYVKRILPKINCAYALLEDEGLLQPGDYAFYEQLGIWGAGFRISILNMILKGKTFKVKEGRLLDNKAKKALLSSHDDFSWVKKYFYILSFSVISFVITVALAFFVKKMGL